jgi:hypothetical protein
MRRLALLCVVFAVPAAAQTGGPRSQSAAAGGAGVQSRLQAQGYGGVHDLHRQPNGQWTGKATQNGVERNVTVAPDGTTIAR